MSSRRSAKGFVLQLSIASTFTTVGGVSKIDFPDADVQFYDGSALDTGVGLEDGEPTGHVAPGQCSGEVFIDPEDPTHEALFGLLVAPAKRDWQIINASLADFECAFNGTLKKLQPTAAVGDGLKANFEIKLSGLPTYGFP